MIPGGVVKVGSIRLSTARTGLRSRLWILPGKNEG